jgi:hypothetical protein
MGKRLYGEVCMALRIINIETFVLREIFEHDLNEVCSISSISMVEFHDPFRSGRLYETGQVKKLTVQLRVCHGMAMRRTEVSIIRLPNLRHLSNE